MREYDGDSEASGAFDVHEERAWGRDEHLGRKGLVSRRVEFSVQHFFFFEGGRGPRDWVARAPYLELVLAGLSLRCWIEYVDSEDLAYVSTGWQMEEILLATWVLEK